MTVILLTWLYMKSNSSSIAPFDRPSSFLSFNPYHRLSPRFTCNQCTKWKGCLTLSNSRDVFCTKLHFKFGQTNIDYIMSFIDQVVIKKFPAGKSGSIKPYTCSELYTCNFLKILLRYFYLYNAKYVFSPPPLPPPPGSNGAWWYIGKN